MVRRARSLRSHGKIGDCKQSTYIQNLVSLKSQDSYNLRLSGGILLTSSTFRTKFTLGVRSFQVAAPKFIWDALLRELRDIPNVHTFKSNLKVARLDFSGEYVPSLSINYAGMSKDMGKSLPQHTVLYKDENFLWSGFYCNYWSHHGNIMTPLRFYLSLCFSVVGVFLRNCWRKYVPAIVASIMAKFEQILWERCGNISKQSFKNHKNGETACYAHH